MVFVSSWDQFATESERLFLSEPLRTRFSFKYRAGEGVFVLKVTDDKTCLKYKSDQKSDIRKMESLTGRLMGLMTAEQGESDLQPDAQAT